MSKTAPDVAVHERIHAIWDALADFEVARIDEALAFLQAGLCELINAQNADWIGVMRQCTVCADDPTGGWRTPVVSVLHPNEKFLTAIKERTRNLERGMVNQVMLRILGNSGDFRVCRLRDVMPREWFDSPAYRSHYLDCGYGDAVYVAFPLNFDTESWFGLFRTTGQPPFTTREREMLAYTLRGIKWFHRQLLLSHGLLTAGTTLTPVERGVLHGLMTGLSEKDIAAAQGQSFHTTHDHVRSIFHKFGVNNRSALMALWLGGSPPV